MHDVVMILLRLAPSRTRDQVAAREHADAAAGLGAKLGNVAGNPIHVIDDHEQAICIAGSEGAPGRR
jgi:hypothetical protein